LESTDFEDAIRNAISLGGDSDTLAAITGSIAEAAYGIPDWIKEKAYSYLDDMLLNVLQRWRNFCLQRNPHIFDSKIPHLDEICKMKSDENSTHSMGVNVVGTAEITKKEHIEAIDFLLSRGIIDKDRYQEKLDEINEKYSD
jgi:hypothetical protein